MNANHTPEMDDQAGHLPFPVPGSPVPDGEPRRCEPREPTAHPEPDGAVPGGQLPPMTPTAEAVVLVTGLQQDARAEAASRGALIRKTARLFTVTYTLAAGRALEGWVRQDSFRTSPQAGMRNRAQTPARTRTEVLRDAEDEARHYIAGELEMALLIPHGSALELLRQAIVLVVHLPQVLDRLEAGEILWDQVRVILDQWSALSAIHFPTPLLDPSILDKHTASDLGLTAEFGGSSRLRV